MAVLSRRCKPDNSESHNSLKLRPFRIFAWIKLPCHSCSVWDKLRWLNRFWQSLCEVYLPLIQKDSITHRHGITHRHVCEGRTLLSSYWSPFLCLCTVFDAISCNRWGSLDQPIECRGVSTALMIIPPWVLEPPRKAGFAHLSDWWPT